jgi:uncharacterized damage-inducible protein DinB
MVVIPDLLVRQYERTHWIIVKQTEGLTHADSLLQLPFRGNCLNWTLGHILVYRDRSLEMLGQGPVLSADGVEIYRRGSEPLTVAGAAIPLERLLAALDETQGALVTGLKKLTPDALEAKPQEDGERRVGEMLAFWQWHETYHVGQLEILRQLAGKDDAII